MITPSICELAVGMAATSLVLQLASAVARGNRSTDEASTDPVGASPAAAPKPKAKPMPTPTLVRLDGKPVHPVPSLKLTVLELRAHARALGLRNGHWRKYANKNDLCREIQAHYKQQEASS